MTKAGFVTWSYRAGALALAGLVGCGGGSSGTPDAGDDSCSYHTAADEIADPQVYTPRWAFLPWISKDISDDADTRAFVAGFRDRDIPIGVVVIDSPWETHYNTFVPNPSRYPGFDQLVADLHDDDLRIVLWTTQMVNTSSIDLEPDGDTYEGASPNFAEGERCNFFVNENNAYLWWKGAGAGVDFFNPDAVAWWRRQQDPLLELGIDGWKLDFGEQYIPEPITTADGAKTLQEYSEAYYRDFYAYGASVRGTADFVTMVRPWDESYGFDGRFYARPEHAPVAWVGDQQRDWVGLADALDHIFRSAREGYVMVGSDIGGYLDRPDIDQDGPIPFDTEVFARWTAVGAMTPFMQLHGRANITPWTVPDRVDETVALYRYWSHLHTDLVPFFYSLAQEAYAGAAGPIIRPIGEPADWPGDYRFMVGDAFLVAPILDATGTRDVLLPDGRWYEWFNPVAVFRSGNTTVEDYDATDLARVPLFVKAGAIIPAEVTSDVSGLGNAASAGHLTVVIYPDRDATSFDLHDADDAVTEITQVVDNGVTTITLSRALAPTILRIQASLQPNDVELDGVDMVQHPDRASFDAATSGYLEDEDKRQFWVKFPASTEPLTLVTRAAAPG